MIFFFDKFLFLKILSFLNISGCLNAYLPKNNEELHKKYT